MLFLNFSVCSYTALFILRLHKQGSSAAAGASLRNFALLNEVDTKRGKVTKQTHQSGDFPLSLVFALGGGVRAAALGKHFRILADLSMLYIIVFSTEPPPLFPRFGSGADYILVFLNFSLLKSVWKCSYTVCSEFWSMRRLGRTILVLCSYPKTAQPMGRSRICCRKSYAAPHRPSADADVGFAPLTPSKNALLFFCYFILLSY